MGWVNWGVLLARCEHERRGAKDTCGYTHTGTQRHACTCTHPTTFAPLHPFWWASCYLSRVCESSFPSSVPGGEELCGPKVCCSLHPAWHTGCLVRGWALSSSSISAGKGHARLPVTQPSACSSAGESGPAVPAHGPVLCFPSTRASGLIRPSGAQGLTNIGRASLLVGRGGTDPSVSCFSVRTQQRVQPPAHGWSSREATSMLPPPLPPVIVPLKWRLIFQSV